MTEDGVVYLGSGQRATTKTSGPEIISEPRFHAADKPAAHSDMSGTIKKLQNGRKHGGRRSGRGPTLLICVDTSRFS